MQQVSGVISEDADPNGGPPRARQASGVTVVRMGPGMSCSKGGGGVGYLAGCWGVGKLGKWKGSSKPGFGFGIALGIYDTDTRQYNY